MKRTRSLLVIGALLALLAATTATPASAVTYRTKMLNLINRARDRHDVHAVKLNFHLSGDALDHSQQMADDGFIYHTANMTAKLKNYHWSICGENVGKAHTLKRVKDLWMASPPHRANLLNKQFHKVGIGVVHQDGWFWVTVILYG